MFHHERDSSILQFAPARAKKKIAGEHELDLVAGCYDEQKIDGSRYVIQTGYPTRDGAYQHAVTSRRESVETGRFVEKTDRVPHLSNMEGLPELSMFDNEFVSPADIVLAELPGKYWDKMMDRFHPHMIWLKERFGGALPVYPHVSSTTSIMGSDAGRAISLQQEVGHVWAYCFDIMRFKGQRVSHNEQLKRRNFLAKILQEIPAERGMILMPGWWGLTLAEKEELFYLFTDLKGEGLIHKDPSLPYNHARAWWKWKRDYPADVVLTGGYKMGKAGKTGKMEGKVGSLEVGVYEKGVLYPVGWMSAIMNSEAKLTEVTQACLDGTIVGRVCECRHNGTQKKKDSPLGYTLRHPRWRRWRDDEKNASDCTSEALLAEVD